MVIIPPWREERNASLQQPPLPLQGNKNCENHMMQLKLKQNHPWSQYQN